jgi:transcriptional regulator with XRE-family HTH domain
VAKTETRSFGSAIRNRRRQLDLTQEEVAKRIKMSAQYINQLEARKRRPSQQVILKLAAALALDARHLFLLANPKVGSIISERQRWDVDSAWDAFVKEKVLRKIYSITDQEMEILSHVAMIGDVRSPRDFIFILIAIRHALDR